VLAPFTPFLAEELYQKITGGKGVVGSKLSESVHLQDWPDAGQINELLIDDMNIVRQAVTEGLSARAQAKIKVRQPLQKVTLHVKKNIVNSEVVMALYDELNVKEVNIALGVDKQLVELDTKITPVLKREGLMREVVRNVQGARKQAGLNVDDRIVLKLYTDDKELAKAITEHAQTIADETLAVSITQVETNGSSADVHIEGANLKIDLVKA
jgi:isoleucyl-tRNA synthetase